MLEEVDTKDLNGITIDPFKIMNGSVQALDYSVKHLEHEEERVVGQESYEVKERTRGWFKGIVFGLRMNMSPSTGIFVKPFATLKAMNWRNGI